MTISVKGKAQKLEDMLIGYRRHFHQNPELSREEEQTSRTIQEFLKEEGIPYESGFATHGVLGVIEGGKPGSTVALRADIDALPIREKNDVPYKSGTEGKMHACGHDAHTAMLMGTAKLLNEIREDIPGKVLLVFQPAEELAPVGGAADMMKDGVFEKHRPDVIFAQHMWPDLPVGQLGVINGPVMGNSDRFSVTIEGAGGHASMPHQGKDAIVIAAQVISHLQTVVSRNVDPMESAVITFGEIKGGDRYNVIASSVTIEGTVRTNKDSVKKKVKHRLRTTLEGLADANEVTITLDYKDGYPATVNSPEWVDTVTETAHDLLGKESTPLVNPSLGGEDFGRFLLEYPGFYYWLGTAIPERETQKPLHDAEFDINEKSLVIGTETMAQLALNAIERLNREHSE
ncbi:M20 metallopeptidase family protein [Alteribacter natronophilus]|uniref:M20 metallopeptidase family protein n=1 Tax=Alteribacter natronophilus TaxID=2583810 RepID=UPI00110D27C6|nr:M20 family metallopeptidase [Alteribacter natronophilus]TMW70464.1 amidohydrolase [Alteribacter natronophilus]